MTANRGAHCRQCSCPMFSILSYSLFLFVMQLRCEVQQCIKAIVGLKKNKKTLKELGERCNILRKTEFLRSAK